MNDSRSHFDFILTGDFRYPGGTSAAVADEINVLRNSGWSWKLHQFNSKVFVNRPTNHRITAVASATDFVEDSAEVTCSTWFLHNPHSFVLGKVPRTSFRADRIVIVAHQSPTSFSGRFYYDPWRIDDIIRKEYPDADVIWAPISPLCRRMFENVEFDREILGFDWVNIFSGPFEAPSGIDSSRPARVGCHGRQQPEKWPVDRKTALLVYPDDPSFEVTLLGPDPRASGPIAPFPSRWRTYRFNEISVREFMRKIDFFVYRPHPDLVEAFGRTIAEAVLNAKLAILPPSLEPTFGDLATYAEPDEVQGIIRRFHQNPEEYLAFTSAASDKARALYGSEGFLNRLARVASVPAAPRKKMFANQNPFRSKARRDSRHSGCRHALKLLAKRAIICFKPGTEY